MEEGKSKVEREWDERRANRVEQKAVAGSMTSISELIKDRFRLYIVVVEFYPFLSERRKEGIGFVT